MHGDRSGTPALPFGGNVDPTIPRSIIGSPASMLLRNAVVRDKPWPPPLDKTWHQLNRGDARDLSWIASQTVHLVVTSPPYWNLKPYHDRAGQLGHIAD